jgi:SnoaL-like protein
LREKPLNVDVKRGVPMGLAAMDYIEIIQLRSRYEFALDFGDFEGYADCWTPDGVFTIDGIPKGSRTEGVHKGREGLIALAQEIWGFSKGMGRHWTASPVIKGDGDTATHECYMMTPRLDAGGPGVLIAASGVYRDVVKKVDGTWLFHTRHMTIDPQLEHRA